MYARPRMLRGVGSPAVPEGRPPNRVAVSASFRDLGGAHVDVRSRDGEIEDSLRDAGPQVPAERDEDVRISCTNGGPGQRNHTEMGLPRDEETDDRVKNAH